MMHFEMEHDTQQNGANPSYYVPNVTEYYYRKDFTISHHCIKLMVLLQSLDQTIYKIE